MLCGEIVILMRWSAGTHTHSQSNMTCEGDILFRISWSFLLLGLSCCPQSYSLKSLCDPGSFFFIDKISILSYLYNCIKKLKDG